MKNVIAGGVLGFVLLYASMLYFDWPAIEQDLTRRTVAELTRAGHGWVKVTAHGRGRDLLLGGSAPDDQARAEAIRLARQVWGVRAVETHIVTLPPVTPGPADPVVRAPADQATLDGPVASQSDGAAAAIDDPAKVRPMAYQPAAVKLRLDDRDQLVVGGRVSDHATANAITAAARAAFGVTSVDHRWQFDARLRSEPWLAEVPAFLNGLDLLQTDTLSFDGTRISVEGAVASEQARRRIAQLAGQHFGDRVELVDLVRVVDPASVARPSNPPSPRTEPAAGDACQEQFDALLAEEPIRFESNNARLQPISYWVLDSVAKVMARCPNSRVRIEGHTDTSGSSTGNATLSLQRAVSVGDYLRSAGIAAARLQTVGRGAREPLADNATPAGRALNRRIALRVIH